MIDRRVYLSPEILEEDPILLARMCFVAQLLLTASKVDKNVNLDLHDSFLINAIGTNPVCQPFGDVLALATSQVLNERYCEVGDFKTERLRRKGCVISFDGINGAGKTTLIHALGMESLLIKRKSDNMNIAASLLDGRYRPDKIRLSGLMGISETLLLTANLYYQLVVQPKVGLNIIDRGTLSLFAYQMYVLMSENGLSRESAENYLKLLLSGIPHPDISYFLDVDIITAAKRSGMGEDDFLGYQQIRENFLEGISLIPNCHRIDATKELPEVVNELLEMNQ